MEILTLNNLFSNQTITTASIKSRRLRGKPRKKLNLLCTVNTNIPNSVILVRFGDIAVLFDLAFGILAALYVSPEYEPLLDMTCCRSVPKLHDWVYVL